MAFTSETYPGVAEKAPEASRGFRLNHSMLRVKDPAVSLDFYTRVMGMRVLRKLERIHYNVWQQRPALSKWEKAALVGGALWRRVQSALW